MQVSVVGSLPNQSDALVQMPIIAPGFLPTINKGGTATASSIDGGYLNNSDGSGTTLYISIPTGLNNGVQVVFPFWGKTFGLRFLHNVSEQPLSVLIDGIAYEVPAKYPYLDAEGYSSYPGDYGIAMVTNDLDDGIHFVEIDIVAPASGTLTLNILGYLVEERAGYRKLPPGLVVVTSNGATPTTSTKLSKSTTLGIRKVFYVNTTASPITISITHNSVLMWSKSVPANDTVDFDPASLWSVNANYLFHQASGAGLNFTALGGV